MIRKATRRRKNPTDTELLLRSQKSGKGHADADARGYVLYFGGNEYIIGDVTAEKAYKKIMELTEKGDDGSFARQMHRNNPGRRSRASSTGLRRRNPPIGLPRSIGATTHFESHGKRLSVKKKSASSFVASVDGSRSQVNGPSGTRWGNAEEIREDVAHFLSYGTLPSSGNSNPRRRR